MYLILIILSRIPAATPRRLILCAGTSTNHGLKSETTVNQGNSSDEDSIEKPTYGRSYLGARRGDAKVSFRENFLKEVEL